MRRKRIKKVYVSALKFEYMSYKEANKCIKSFITELLTQIGLVYKVDYYISGNSLKIRHIKDIVGKVLIILKEAFPVFNYYWETPRILIWF